MSIEFSFHGSVGEVTADESVVLEKTARRLYFNIDSGELYARFDVRSPIQRWDAKRGDTQRIHLYIVDEEQEDDEIMELPAGATIRLDAVQTFGGDKLVSCTSWAEAEDEDGYTYYEGILDFNTVELNAAMGYGEATELTRLDLKADIQITDGAATISSNNFTLRVNNDPSRPEGDAPTTVELQSGFQFKPLITGLTGGGATNLDGFATVGLTAGTVIVGLLIGGVWQIWALVAGTDAENADGGFVRPDDYATTTNEKVWVKKS